ncbi:MAG TPA: hypothetical protein PKD90_19260, partial [Phnomibacter sp.]|nr:hypothetical protein [Phnomibacter sp.]
MNKWIYTPAAAMLLLLGSCQKHLDRKPLDASSATNFLNNQAEIEQGLTGVYASAMWVFPNNTPLLFAVESSTDMAIKRGGNAEDVVALGSAASFNVNNALVNTCWSQAYRLIQRANQQISGMENGR